MHHHQEYESPSALSDTIKCFWYDRRDVGEKLSSYDVMPDGYAEIIFYFGSLYGISPDDSLQPLPSPFMMGLLNQPVSFTTNTGLVDALILSDNLSDEKFKTIEAAIDDYERQMFVYAGEAQHASSMNEQEMHRHDFSFMKRFVE